MSLEVEEERELRATGTITETARAESLKSELIRLNRFGTGVGNWEGK